MLKLLENLTENFIWSMTLEPQEAEHFSMEHKLLGRLIESNYLKMPSLLSLTIKLVADLNHSQKRVLHTSELKNGNTNSNFVFMRFYSSSLRDGLVFEIISTLSHLSSKTEKRGD